jgi:hypothetical protein
MSAPSGNSKPANVQPASPSWFIKMGESMKSGSTPIAVLIGGIATIALLITTFVKLSSFAGDVDNWTSLKPKINEIIIYTLVATFITWITLIYYVAQKPEHSIYITVSIAVLAVGLAFGALSVAVITR